MPLMTFKTQIFILLVTAAGSAAAAVAVINWTSTHFVTFLTALIFCLATSLLRVVLPGIEGSFSLSYVVLVWGIAHLSSGETILMGTASALIQSYWRCIRRPRPIQVVFNIALISLSVAIGSFVFSSTIAQSLTPSTIIRTVLASAAYFVINTCCVSTVIALTECRSAWNVWVRSYLWTFPHYLLAASIAVAVEAVRNAVGDEILCLVLPALYLVFHTVQVHIKGLNQVIERAEMLKQHAESTADLHLRTIRSLALAIEAKDRTTGEHLHRVQTYALALGQDLGLSREDLDALRAASILHDIGKLAVPEHIISKPGKLTPDEFAKMKVHPVVGAEIVESVKFPFPVAPLVRSHHEKWDGTGYPDGLQGDQIPLGARILTAVDCLDALATDRQYRKALPLDRAMAIVRAESGKSFDPRVVEALEKRYQQLEQLARATLDTSPHVELSSDLVVDRGASPDAGYESYSRPNEKSGVSLESVSLETSIIDAVRTEMRHLRSLGQTMDSVQISLRRLIPFDALALYAVNGNALGCVYSGGSGADILAGLTIPIGTGVSGWVCANGKPLLNGNALTEFGVSGVVPSTFELRSGLAIALESECGPTAVLTLYSRDAETFSMDHLRVVLAVKSSISYYLRLESCGFAADDSVCYPQAVRNKTGFRSTPESILGFAPTDRTPASAAVAFCSSGAHYGSTDLGDVVLRRL